MISIGVCTVLINEKNQILMGVRKNTYKSGLHGLPGGRVELGEELEQSAKRELLEEANLSALEISQLGVIRENQEGHDFVHFAYLCRQYEGNLVNLEASKCEGWEWVDFNDLPSNILPAHKIAIDLANNRINTKMDEVKLVDMCETYSFLD